MYNLKTFSLSKYFLSIASVLLLVILFNYANSLYSPFQFDDDIVVKHNPAIKDNTYLQLSHIRYRHIFYLTFALNYNWGKLNPFGYHLFNVFLHFLTAMIVCFISFITIEKGVGWGKEAAFKIAGMTSLLFALNPAHSETVTYISGRGSGLAAFFYLLSLLMFILGSLKYERMRFFGQLFYLISLFSCLMAVFSKEISVTLPAAIILYDVCFMRSKKWIKFWNRFFCFYLLFSIAAFYFYVKASSLVSFFNQWIQKFDVSYALSQLKVISSVIKIYFLPINLAFDYDLTGTVNFGEVTYILSVLFLAVILFLAFKKFYQKTAILSFSILFFFITISPTNSILPRMDIFSDRNLYLPSVGLSLFFAVVIYLFFSVYQRKYAARSLMSIGCLVIILSAYSALLIKRNEAYKTNLSLWEETYKKSPGRMRVLHNLSNYYLLKNDSEKAFVMLKRLVVFNPTNYYAHVNLGKLYIDYGHYEMAEKEFKEAINVDPTLPEAHFNLGSYYALTGLFDRAKEEYEKADVRYDWNLFKLPELFRDKMRAKLILNKAKLNSASGLFKEAEKELKRYLKMYPDSAEANYLLGQIYSTTGKEELAIDKFEKSKGDNLIRAKAHNSIALIYIKQSRFEEAITEFEKAISLNPDFLEAHFNLGKIYMEIRKDDKKARVHLERLLALQPDHNKTKIIKKMLLQLHTGQ